MGATATLSTPNLAVEPGQEITCSITIRNSGGVVDQFTVDVVGEAHAWAVAEPGSVNVLPGHSATVLVRFAPPRSSDVVAGSVPFGIRVSSREDPDGSVVEEGVIEVAPFAELVAEVVPNKAAGSVAARFEVAIDNLGNAPVPVRVEAVDREDALNFRVQRSSFDLESGTTAFIRMKARPKRRFLRGQPQWHPFQVLVSTDGGQPTATDATMVQKQLLPKWLLPVLAALLALIVLLATLWFTTLRPAVASAAREAVERQTAPIQRAAEQARMEAAQAKQNADQAMRAAGLDPAAPPTGGQNPPGVPVSATRQPIDFRISADAPVVAETTRFREFSYTPPEGKTLVVLDLFLQNPRADYGTLRILRDVNGQKSILFDFGLNNFRDLDYHWVQGWRFQPGEKVVLAVSCQNPPEPGRGNCTPSASFSGILEG
jgi:type II secretory pathway pseudopilin PulG